MAGRCPNVRWVPGFTKRAGGTPLVWEPPRAPDHITREEERWRAEGAPGSGAGGEGQHALLLPAGSAPGD